MKVRAKKIGPVKNEGQAFPKDMHGTVTLPAPTRGLVLNENMAATEPGAALHMENWFPLATGVRLRNGLEKFATISASNAVNSMWPFSTTTTDFLFAADDTNIFDISSPADATTIPTADVTGQTAGYYVTAAMATSGGEFLYAVNGADDAQLFDGTNWQAVNNGSSPISVTSATTSQWACCWVHANRLFFGNKDSLTVDYLPVESVGGAASQFNLRGVFDEGGALLFGTVWSVDAGDGLDDKCVFVSNKGEVAVYEGTDPSSSFALVGKYKIGRPLGRKAFYRRGGDVLIATEGGIVPLSAVFSEDMVDLSLAAATRPIEPEWTAEAALRTTYPWEFIKWERANQLVTVMPAGVSDDLRSFVRNMETKAWCEYTGWDMRCGCTFGDQGYIGTSDGEIMQIERGGDDDGALFTGRLALSFSDLGQGSAHKSILQARALFRARTPFNVRTSVSANYGLEWPAVPNSVADFPSSEWDDAQWDVGLWGTLNPYAVTQNWQSIGMAGHAVAPMVQITSGTDSRPIVELMGIDLTFRRGGVVV